jgi:uncharacterized protein YndB with AHSA1/START domain
VLRWWGPRGFTNTAIEMSVKPGGLWRFVMHGPDGVDYPNRVRFIEVVPNERLVYDHGDDSDAPAMFQVTVTFERVGTGQTKLTMRSLFPTAEAVEAVKKFGAVEGGKQTLERLAEYLPHAAGKAFTLTRTFDAPLDLVWKAHTEVEHLRHWWGPKGLAFETAKLDLRPGGTFHYSMKAPDGSVMWGRFLYREIAPQKRLVWTNSFSDPDGGVTRAPFPGAEAFPLEVCNTLTLSADRGRTTIFLYGYPVGASEAEEAFFQNMFQSMTQGFSGTFDQLEAYLAQKQGPRG